MSDVQTDSDKLRLLADWFDSPKIQTMHPEWTPDDNEVQVSLRRIAKQLTEQPPRDVDPDSVLGQLKELESIGHHDIGIYPGFAGYRSVFKTADIIATIEMLQQAQADLPRIVDELHDAFADAVGGECTYAGEHLPADCGNWDACREECPLRQLRELAGYKPREDGRLGKVESLETHGEDTDAS